MIENLLIDNNFYDYGIIIGCGLILGCSVYYLIRGNNIANLPNNTEALTNQEIEAINNENMVPNSNIEDPLTDSDLDTDSDHANISDYDTASTADFDEIVQDPDLLIMPSFESKFRNVEFIMPDVDFNVCPIQELKLFEFCSLYVKEMAEHSISEEEMMELICAFPERDLATN
jgi:hypothetical protein